MTLPWQRSIRAQLAASITLALAIVLLLATFVSYFAVRNMLYANADVELHGVSRSLSAMLDKNPAAAEVAAEFFHDSLPLDQTVYVQILSRENAPLFISPSLAGQHLPVSLLPEIGTVRLNKLDARFHTEASVWYFLTVAVPVSNIESSLWALRLTFAIAIPFALLTTLLIGQYIAKRGFRPIDDATAAARRISSQNLRERLPAPKHNDEIGRLVQTLNDMIGRLERSFASISEFTTNAAHEMRTPLTILRGEMEIELRKQSLIPATRKLIESNIEEVNRLIRIVENLFILSRSDAQQLALTLREIQLEEILEKNRRKAESLASSKSIKIVMVIHASCTIIGDAEMLSQVIMNLVENAVKYSPEHGAITLTLSRSGNEAILTVADKGIGVDERHKAKIFERFYRTDDARSRDEGGAGLGLAITQNIVAAHRGAINVESALGEGSTFIIQFPLAEIE